MQIASNLIKSKTLLQFLILYRFNNRFKIVKICNNVFDLIKLEAICILLKKPVLCKQKDFDYTVSLFS